MIRMAGCGEALWVTSQVNPPPPPSLFPPLHLAHAITRNPSTARALLPAKGCGITVSLQLSQTNMRLTVRAGI